MTIARSAQPTDAAQRPARRRCVLMLAALLFAGALATVPAFAAPAGAITPAEQDYVNQVNALRTGLGLRPLIVDANLTVLAQQHTQEMAASQDLHHTADLVAGVSSTWEKLGENVGFGSNTPLVWNAFLNSPHHYENLVDPAFTHIGVGVVVDANGLQWTTHRFMTLAAPTPPPFVPPAPVAQPAPAPAAAPRPVAPAAPAKVTPAPAATNSVLVPVVPAGDIVPVEAPAATDAPAVLSPADPSRVSATLMALHAI
jgi:uncharacterized protein YkwD